MTPRTRNNKKKNTVIRSKRLDSLNESQLALAIWLMARNIVEDQTSRPQARLEALPDEAPVAVPASEKEAA